MMVPFDQSGVPQQGQPQQMRQPMAPGHVQPSGAVGMQPGHHQGMNPPPYGHRNTGAMPGQPPYMPPSPAQRNGSFSGQMHPNNAHFSSHAPLHQPQGGPPLHPMNQQMHHPPPMARNHGGMQPMPPMQHDPMRNSVSGHRPQQPPPPQQHQQQQYNNQQQPPQEMSGSWQSSRDTDHRRKMIHQIVQLLKKDKKDGGAGSDRLAQMAKHLEVSLYRKAPSFVAYMDPNTLKKRLHEIAAEVSKKSSSRSDPHRGGSSSSSSFPNHNGMRSNSSTSPYMGSMSNGGGGSSRGMNRMDDMNMNAMQGGNGASGSSNNNGSSSVQYSRSGGGGGGGHSQRGSSQRGGDYDQRVRHKQQRLLLLHHSAKCKTTGHCTVTPHCADMKRLWKHMEGCKDNQCRVAHCFSSRAILSHYRKCKDPRCPACAPVRETVQKSQQRSRSSRPNQGQMGGMGSSSQGQQAMLGGPSDSMSSQIGSFGSGSMSQQRTSPHPGMPPPAAGSQSNDMQFSSSYNRSAGTGGSNSGSKQKDTLGASMPSAGRPADSSESEWQKIRHKQQRLLLLRHASKCQHSEGTCPVTPHCASMKKLWEHIANCKDQQCKVQHCLSSRYVLSHYRRCRNTRCPSCGPVRDSIRRAADKDRSKRNQQVGGGNASFDALQGSSSAAGPDPMSSTSDSMQPEKKRMRPDDGSIATLPVSNTSARPVSSSRAVPKPEMAKSETAKSGTTKGQQSDPSLLHCFTVKELNTHLESLDRKLQLPPAKLKAKCLEVLKGLQSHQHGWVFNCPVDPEVLDLPDYFEIIKKPMDLGTIQKRLESGGFHEIQTFQQYVNLTFNNAMTYNESHSAVYGMASELKVKFENDMRRLTAQLEEEDRERRQNERACTLCGCEKLLFEPPIYYCCGTNCQTQSARIRRNNNFYIGGNNQYFWCSACYNELDDKVPIEFSDMRVMKADLRKKRNDEVHEESWVQCDTCETWVHQICGLFNTRQNKEHHSEYCCPRCLRDRRAKEPPSSYPSALGAAELPRTVLSEWLEKHIVKRVEKRRRELVEDKAQSDNISLEEANKELGCGGEIIIRQVTAMDRKLEVRELMQKRYAHKNYPEEFPFRCKCIVVFQRLDGVDVVLFALYVYEHGENNPPPNQRVVYISYLDSVHFMRPRRLRTFVYHEILIAYLDYARRKGFATAHIWACPPLKGDDYIFFAKPEDQKTPRDSRLRQWYIDMLIECQRRNIVGKVTNLYDHYLANEDLDATAVPYLDGDYFPGEAENIIKMLQEGKGKKGGKGGSKKKNKATAKNKGNTGTRSTGVDEEALLASGILDEAKTFKDLDRDQVMVKLGETIQPMKDSFIVAFLNWSGAKKEDLEVPPEIEKERIEYLAKPEPDLIGSKRDAMGNAKDSLPKVKDDGQVKVVDDDEEELDCEFLNSRQEFLNLCRGNHYQFDELRRAKHTSMMVLWHLHNRDAPKFVQQCVACGREILSGKRYHCNQCPDYDLCQDCFKDPKANRGTCTHKLTAISVAPSGGQERSGLTDAQRIQRQRNLMMHIQLIEHATGCTSKSCTSSNCARMKGYLGHAKTCKTKVQGGCKICKRIWTLLRIHAQKCKKKECPIPQCTAIREKMRQLQKQQQAMDDRRRLEMNRHMRCSMAGGSD